MAGRRTISNSFNVVTVDEPISVVAQYSPTNNPTTSSQIHSSFQSGDIFMRTRNTDETFSGNVDPNHPWNRIVGENGDETDYRFATSAYKEPTANGYPADLGSDDSYWSDAPVATTQRKPYLWSRVQKKSWNESTQSYVIDSTRYIRLTGEGGEEYIIESTQGSVTIDSNQTTGSLSTTLSFYKKEGSKDRVQYPCYCTIFRKKGTSYTWIRIYGEEKAAAVTYTHQAGQGVPELTADNYDAIVVCMFDTPSITIRSGCLAELEIPVRKNGDSPFVVDLDNEMTNVAVDEDNKLVSAADIYFEVRAFVGTTNAIDSCTVTPSCSNTNVTVSYNSTTHKVRAQIAAGTQLSDTTTISIQVVHASFGTRNLSPIIAAVKGGKNAVLQELLPSLNEISFARQDDGTLSPPNRSLSLNFKKTEGDTTTIQSLSDAGLTVMWSESSMPSAYNVGNSWGQGTPTGITWNNITMQIANSVPSTNIYIAAFKQTGESTYVLVDRETIPIIKDGKHGDNAPYVELSRTTILYEATNAGASSSSQDFPVSYTIKIKGVSLTVGDTSSVSFSLPSGITVKSGTKTTSGVTFHVESGASPSGVITITMYGTDSNSISYNASASITVGANKKGENGDDAEFYKIDTDIDSVVIPSDQSSITLSTAPKAYFKKVKGSTESSQVMQYAVYWRSGSSYTQITYPAGHETANISLPTQYSSSYDALVVFGRVLYAASYKNYDAKKEIVILKNGNTGSPGNPGPRGKMGRSYYYAAEWNPNDNTKSFLVDDAQAPFFSNAGSNLDKYYIFNSETNGSYTMYQMADTTTVSGSIDWNSAPWALMTDDFKYIITEALFTKFAKLGSAIFNEDFMYSKYLNNELSMYYSYSGQSIARSISNDYALLVSQTSLPVVEGKQYKISITCYHNSSYSDALYSRVYYNTKSDWSGTSFGSSAFIGVGSNTENTYNIDFVAVQNGYVRIYNCGYGTIKKIAASQSESYEKVSPMFINTDDVPLLTTGGVATTSTSSNMQNVVNTAIPVIYGRRYDVTFDASISAGGAGYVCIYSETGSLLGSTTITYSSLNPDVNTYILTIDPCYHTGNAYLKFYVENSSYTLTLTNIYIKCPNAFVPQVIVDWLAGYAHFSGDRVRFNPDGSGHLANQNISWNTNGDLSISGYVKKKKVIINSGNYSYYIKSMLSSYTVLDVSKCGSWVELSGYITSGTLEIELPNFSADVPASSDEKDFVRSFGGTVLQVYNRSTTDIEVILSREGGVSASAVTVGKACTYECRIDQGLGGSERVRWLEISEPFTIL